MIPYFVLMHVGSNLSESFLIHRPGSVEICSKSSLGVLKSHFSERPKSCFPYCVFILKC